MKINCQLDLLDPKFQLFFALAAKYVITIVYFQPHVSESFMEVPLRFVHNLDGTGFIQAKIFDWLLWEFLM